MAIMFMLFAMYTGALNPFAPFEGTAADRYSDPNALPWEEGHLFIDQQLDSYEMGGRRGPFRSQLKLEDTLRYTAEVYDGDNQLGEIYLIILGNGDAEIKWTGEFKVGRRNYQAIVEWTKSNNILVNKFMGNIAPLKIYEDENGRDLSKLYFITSGPFRFTESTGTRSLEGTAYITGWIGKKYKASGEIFIFSFADGQPKIFDWGPIRRTKNKKRNQSK